MQCPQCLHAIEIFPECVCQYVRWACDYMPSLYSTVCELYQWRRQKPVHINYVETEAPMRHPHLHYRMWLISKMPPTQVFVPSAIPGRPVFMFKSSQWTLCEYYRKLGAIRSARFAPPYLGDYCTDSWEASLRCHSCVNIAIATPLLSLSLPTTHRGD